MKKLTPGQRLGLGLVLLFALITAGARAGFPGAPRSAAPSAPLVLTYLANEGVLLSVGDKKVLIDALFDKPNPEYRAPAPEVVDSLVKGTPPFDGVDLLLVTHDHPDHFDAALAARYMAASTGTTLVGPADAVASLRKAAGEAWAGIEPRVVSLDLKVGERAAREFKGIPVTAFRTLHSGDRESPMNLLFLLEMDDWRVFHEGDAPSNVEAISGFGLGNPPIDLDLVHYWYPLEPKAAKLLQEVLKPAHIALMHLPIRLESDAPGKIDQVRGFYKDIFLLLPGMPAKELKK